MSLDAELRAAFNGELVLPGDPDYANAIARWAINAERKARYVTFPKDTQAVSAIVNWADSNNIPIAVKGGGHSASGSSSSEDGLVIDLGRHLNKVTVSEDKKVFFIGGGALWEDVDRAGVENGVATPGGTVNHTGVGGLILGGGYGYLSGEYGMVVDNLVEVTIVLADGRIVTASEISEPDLFWALRGGGGNFGVVTQFVLKCYPQRPTVYGGRLFYPGERIKEVIEVARKWWNAGPSAKEAVLLTAARSPAREPVVAINVFYNGEVSDGEEKFKDFIALGPIVNTAAEVPVPVINTFQNTVAVHGRYTYMTATSQAGPDPDICVSAYHEVLKTSEDGAVDTAFILELYPHEKIASVPVEATAFPARKSQIGVLFMARWDEAGQQFADRAKNEIRSIKDVFIQGASKQAGLVDPEPGYSNYTSEEKLPASSTKNIFKGNYARLQRVKHQYDRNNVFFRWYGIEPAAA
ncbi:FAD-binding domain-containing protein [Sistotremastrum niveocremeum HHB9708]|uniref:FAD-binding domain-containing protein n=1 Tax=Sistotremastrum niveocremeum HHB9708 TaxID=1314777 RepID=A0A164ZFS1_9AGAM|nr:FAD-binding domain-containing protein [Sistotremastrum niveocremeum HHB9708]